MKQNFKPQKNLIALLALLLLTDYLVILLAQTAAYFTRLHLIPHWYTSFTISDTLFYLIIPLIYLAFLHLCDTDLHRLPYWKQTYILSRSISYATLIIVLFIYLGHIGGGISRIYIFLTWLLSLFGILLSRYILRSIMQRYDLFHIPVLFIGAGKTAELVIRSFLTEGLYQYKIIGFIDDHPKSTKLARQYPILGGIKDINKILTRTNVQTIVITVPGLDRSKLLDLINDVQLKVRNVIFVPDLIGVAVGNIAVDGLFNEKTLMLRIQNNLSKSCNQYCKRLFDLTVSLIGILALIPVYLVIGAAIYIDSPGAVIFSHERIGKNGKKFPCYKFRTMIKNAPEILEKYLNDHPEQRKEWETNFKLKNDPRITKIGAFLRRTSLDELPQLFNVLKGEMSLVGPRPIVEEEIEKYREYIEDYYLVLPGITGMWQVNGRSDTSYEERVEMDAWYVRNWSMWLDIVFLVKTIEAVLKKEGAY